MIVRVAESLWKVVKSFQWFFISTEDSVLFCLTNLTPLYNRPSEIYVFNRVLGENVTGLAYFLLVIFFLVVYLP